MNESPSARSNAASPWPGRLALCALACAVPLVFFGGSVTTLHAGLAIDGWLVLDPGRGDYFLWLYPVDRWFRDLGTFVEHTHRLLGSLVGLLAIATVVTTWALDRRRLPRAVSVAALVAVIGQGAIGGFRVLERSEHLAFLHGAIAQAVFALLGASWIALSPGFPAGSDAWVPESVAFGRKLRRFSTAAAASVYLQIVVGAWLRHGGGVDALGLHLVVALPVVILVPLLARELRGAGDRSTGAARSALRTARRWLVGSILGQVALGIGTLVVVSMPAQARADGGLGTAVLPTLHVVGGGILLLSCIASAMLAGRVFPAGATGTLPVDAPELEGSIREQWGAAR